MYIGYFRSLKNKLYKVQIGNSGEEQEIYLGGTPFTVTYNTSNTPFEPIRTSRATIQIVWDTYLEDILPNKAQETPVKLFEILDEEKGIERVEWMGYVAPQLYNQGYVECYETFELECNDCLSTLQYVDYQTKEKDKYGFIQFDEILSNCISNAGLDNYYWGANKYSEDGVITPSQLKIAERNFFSSDVEESWNYLEVLEEMCRYLGYTALQYGPDLYLVDYSQFSSSSVIEALRNGSSSVVLSNPYEVTEESYRASDENISFEPIYNKVTVRDNIFACEEFIPSLVDDKYLTNALNPDQFYAYQQINVPKNTIQRYPHGSKTTWSGIERHLIEETIDKEKNDDSRYSYFYRPYIHKFYNMGSNASIQDIAAVRNPYVDDVQQFIIPDKLDFTRCIKIVQDDATYEKWGDAPAGTGLALVPGFKSQCAIGPDTYLVLNCTALYERHKVDYVNPDWSSEPSKEFPLSEESILHQPRLYFRLRIGDKTYTPDGWSNDRTAYFNVPLKWTGKQMWNQDMNVLNNIMYSEELNCSGYKIPLKDIDTTKEISFEILQPNKHWVIQKKGTQDYNGSFNGRVYLKDFSLKLAIKNSDFERVDSDVTYENIIDSDAVSELSEIVCKYTTYSDMTLNSYSNVLFGDTFLKNINNQIPEINIVDKYVNQYSTSTRRFDNLNITNEVTPFTLITKENISGERYVILGSEIDYSYDRQSLSIMQIK